MERAREEALNRELAFWMLCTLERQQAGGLMVDGVSYRDSYIPDPCGIVFAATSLNKLKSGNPFFIFEQ